MIKPKHFFVIMTVAVVNMFIGLNCMIDVPAKIKKRSVFEVVPALKRPACYFLRQTTILCQNFPPEIRKHIFKNLMDLYILDVFSEDLELLHDSGCYDLLLSIAKFEEIYDSDTLIKLLKICLAELDESLDVSSNDGSNILHCACDKKFSLNCIKIIVIAGGNSIPEMILHKDGLGRTTLDIAIMHGLREVVELFINVVKERPIHLWGKPLHCAAQNENMELITVIVEIAHKLGKVKDLFAIRNNDGLPARESLQSFKKCSIRMLACSQLLKELEEKYCS